MLSILLRVMTLTWRNAFLSITRYVINTATHKGSPHSNKTVIKWFLVAITITIIIFTFFPIYHVATDSVQIQAFCSQFNVQDNVTYQNNSVSSIESPNAPPNMFKYQWILTLAHFALMLLGAALGFAADWKLKVFVERMMLECEQMDIPIYLDDTIPITATRISMSTIVITILAFPLRFVIGTWTFSCALNIMLSLQVPMLAFLTFKHQQENLESPFDILPGKFGATENSRFIKEFPQTEVKNRRPKKIVKTVQWNVGHWGQNGSYEEPSSLVCKEKKYVKYAKYGKSQNQEKSHLYVNTMVTPELSKDEDHIVSQDESQVSSQDLSQYKTPEISLDVSQNVSQDLSNLSQEVQQYVADWLSTDESYDISIQLTSEDPIAQALAQDEKNCSQNSAHCEVSVHMPECATAEGPQSQGKAK